MRIILRKAIVRREGDGHKEVGGSLRLRTTIQMDLFPDGICRVDEEGSEMRIRMKRFAFLWMAFAFAALAWGQAKPAPHPFTPKDWAGLRSAHAAAVSANGTILYSVSFGGEKGPTHTDWWTIGADGNNAKKLEVPDGFHPMGFTRDGASLYGGWKVNDHQ